MNGDIQAARQTYLNALALAQDVVPRLRVEPLMGLAYLAGLEGHLIQAAAYRDEALAHVGGDRYVLALTRLMAALGTLHGGAPAQALPDLQAAHADFTACTDAFGQACTALAQYAASPEAVWAGEAVQAALRFPFLLAGPSLLSPARSRAARAALLARLGEARPEARSGLLPVARALGYPSVPGAHETPGVQVRVQVLGRVTVTRDGGLGRDWGRARARDLLALLVVEAGGLAREVAQEALFPGADPQVGERNFRVTLHALGQILEEGVASGTFLERGDWLRLKPSPDLEVDLEKARTLLRMAAGEPGRAAGLLALPPSLADSDLTAVQEEPRRYAVHLPQALADEAASALNTGQSDLAVRLAERALTLDPAQEPAARVLMRAHLSRGHTAAINRAYSLLCAALTDLGLTPLPETTALARHWTGDPSSGTEVPTGRSG